MFHYFDNVWGHRKQYFLSNKFILTVDGDDGEDGLHPVSSEIRSLVLQIDRLNLNAYKYKDIKLHMDQIVNQSFTQH